MAGTEIERPATARAAVAPRVLVVQGWHQRARQLGLSEQLRPEHACASRAELARLAEQQRTLYTHALPVMELLHEQIVNTHSMVILTDAAGLILHALGDADFLEKAERVALQPGASWSEDHKGTNAIGTALTEARPTLVHGNEHFLLANRFLTCSCSPIRDPHGRVIGALDVSGARQSYHAHTMALVRMSTQMIENHLFVDRFAEAVRIHFHLRPEFLGTITEGIAAFDLGGRFIAANPAALTQLGIVSEALPSHTLGSLFGVTVGALYDHLRSANTGLLTLCLPNRVRVSARVEVEVRAPLHVTGAAVTSRSVRAPPAVRARAAPALEALDGGDPSVAHVLTQVRKVLSHEIPIVILGETGTGKEMLARAIHADSSRADKPFVAVDCAAIPESLIEAELFGYEEGAFTGARRRGSQGRIALANGGTLFLDEIGDMPQALQTRLLRVLQQRTVTPLGSAKSVPVDIAVICATHRNLREMIRSGEFRADLYYRLNGLAVRLPPLRERCDLAVITARILERECGATRLGVTDEVLGLLRRCRWPGNIRQLSNVLRTAAVMAADEGVIRRHHLPEDFLEELAADEALRVPGATGPAAAVDHSSLKALHVAAIKSALDECAGNVSAASRLLGVSRNTIYRTLRAPAG